MIADNLIKLNCLNCDESFIVGETSFDKHKHVNCPFCQSGNTEAVACTTDKILSDLDLGCMGIYLIEESSEEKQKRLDCTEGIGINDWDCYRDCAFWDSEKCTKYEV